MKCLATAKIYCSSFRNVPLEEDLVNIIVGLLAHFALDNTVYLEMYKYKSIESMDFEMLTSRVKDIPRIGRWFLVIYNQMYYQSVQIDWEESTINIFDPYYPFFPRGHSP